MQTMKRFILLLLAAGMVFPTAGCSRGSDPESLPESESAFETTEAQAAVPSDEVIVNFAVSPLDSGTVSGVVSQTLRKGEKTTSVEAVPAAGYSFVKWSDGEKDAVRRAESFEENTTLYALFEEADESTPVIYLNTDDGHGVNSDWATKGFTLSVQNVPRRYALTGATGQVKLRGNASLGWEKNPTP